MEMLFPAVTSGVPGRTRLKFTPSPRQGTGPSNTPATARIAMSVTSSFGRRPLGHPAASGIELGSKAETQPKVASAALLSTVNRF